jgi:hypothetical protein
MHSNRRIFTQVRGLGPRQSRKFFDRLEIQLLRNKSTSSSESLEFLVLFKYIHFIYSMLCPLIQPTVSAKLKSP